ncbi:MAG: peptidoglycan editing factor PgeF [Armatimonadetes bacterium]|nr:peptidoglycan editing factor PgeF [Anaerolineae bacterium]
MSSVIAHEGLRYHQFDGWDGVRHGIFTRHGGVSQAPFGTLNLGGTVGDDTDHVSQNHARMYAALDVDPACTVTVWQVHGVDVVLAHAPLQGRRWLAHADAIITNQPGIALVMRYADCTPVLAYDPVQRAIGMAHAGWRGTVNGMAANLVKAMTQAYGSRPQDIMAGVGPSIGPERYQVGVEVVAAAQAYFGDTDGLVHYDPADGSTYFNLWEANRRDLASADVQHIEVLGICTATQTADWFSHRAESGKTGRFGAVMTLA